MGTNFPEMFPAAQKANDSWISAGLDECKKNGSFIKETGTETCLYKIDPAKYRAAGYDGILKLRANIHLIRRHAPEIPILLDAKYAGSAKANESYAKEAFDFYGVDAVTVVPYMEEDTLGPFFERSDKGIFVVCKSSNEGTGGVQDRLVRIPGSPAHEPLWRCIAYDVANKWNKYGNCGIVIGATHPDALKLGRSAIGEEMLILCPGGGPSQGGDVKMALEAGVNAYGENLIIHFSSEFEQSESPGNQARERRIEINMYRQKRKEAAK